MDITMSIAAMSMNMSNYQAVTNINLSLMGKVLDTAEVQGQAIEEMLSSVDMAMPSQNLLDVYA